MDRKDAAEVILTGKYREKCTNCDGSGQITLGEGNWAIECNVCLALGYTLNLKYRDACRVLRLKLPPIHDDDWDGSPYA